MSLKRKSEGHIQKSSAGAENTSASEKGAVSIGNDIVSLQASLLSRPARKQSNNLNSRFEEHDTDGQEYNIWYHKKLGKRNWRDRDVSDARCNVLKDCGKTRAAKDAYFCLHFAKGRCVNGVDCTYLHRVPTPVDDKRLELTHDIFGRERFKDDREDMGGVGSFSRDNRTLYIGGLRSNQNLNQLEDMIRRGFEEWGAIEYVRVILNKSIAFVRYMFRSSAEFAKQAMADQTLDNGELLNIRWATEDSNPLAKQADERNLHRVATEVVNKRLREMASDDQAALQFQMSGVYPNTDGQFDPNLSQQQQQMYQYQYATSQRYEMHPYARRYNQQLQERQNSGDALDVNPLGKQAGNYFGHTPNEMNMSNDQKRQYDEYLKNYYQYYGFDYTQLTEEQKQQIQHYSQAYYGVSTPAASASEESNEEKEQNNEDSKDNEEDENDGDNK